jgi:glycosyltransferase involved in cell wall biosynthesis
MIVFFVVYNEMFAGVIGSQVVAPARYYAEAHPETRVRIVFLEPARVAISTSAKQRLAALRQRWPQGHMSVTPYVGRLGPSSPAWSLRLRLLASGIARNSILHCRGPEATLQAARVAPAGARIVFDARGAGDHETRWRLAHTTQLDAAAIERSAQQILDMEKRAVSVANAVNAVSPLLADRYHAWTRDAETPIKVIPCCAERVTYTAADRETYRARLGLQPDELLLVHVSSSAHWEAFDQVVDLFRAVVKRRRTRLLFLTALAPDVVLRAVPQDDPIRSSITVTRVSETEVAPTLAAADAGLLLRRPDESFRASSPIKFAEYLAAGLAVAVSDGIGTTAKTISERRIGIVLPPNPEAMAVERAADELVSLLAGDREELRRRTLVACEQEYVWSAYRSSIATLYGQHQR